MSPNPTPSEEEAAAIAAAIQRFQMETAPVAAEEEATSAWQRAALLEGVSARSTVLKHREGGSKWLS